MKKTLFLKTESGTIVVPRLVNSNWLGRWAYDKWLRKHFKQEIQKAAPKPWKTLSSMFEVETLVEENNIYRVENSETNNKE